MTEELGLYNKYYVCKVSGEPLENCFVLRPDRDKYALYALRFYANIVKDVKPILSMDLLEWIKEFEL
jgi:hypothetical protein